MDQEWQKVLNEALEKLETIGFFAAIGIHFAESTPLLSEELGEHIKGAPWERFSSTDQCFKMIHQLATRVWHNLEGMATSEEPKVLGEKDQVKEIIEPEAPKDITKLPSYFQSIEGELRLLKTLGESIVSLTGHEKQDLELDHEQVKTLGEMVINVVTTINEKLQELKGQINQEAFEGEVIKGHMGEPLELIGEDLTRIKAFGTGIAYHDSFKLNPRQIETIGQMIINLADKVTGRLKQTGFPPSSLP
jgi:hypothetical protein